MLQSPNHIVRMITTICSVLHGMHTLFLQCSYVASNKPDNQLCTIDNTWRLKLWKQVNVLPFENQANNMGTNTNLLLLL